MKRLVLPFMRTVLRLGLPVWCLAAGCGGQSDPVHKEELGAIPGEDEEPGITYTPPEEGNQEKTYEGKTLEDWIVALRDDVPESACPESSRGGRCRSRAAIVLGTVGKEAVPLLIVGLRDATARVRENAADALGEIGAAAAEAIPELVGLLKDKDAAVRDAATLSLWEMGHDLDPGSVYIKAERAVVFAGGEVVAAVRAGQKVPVDAKRKSWLAVSFKDVEGKEVRGWITAGAALAEREGRSEKARLLAEAHEQIVAQTQDRKYEQALLTCDDLIKDPKYSLIQKNLQTTESDLQRAGEVLATAKSALATQVGKPVRVKGIMTKLVEVKGNTLVLDASGARLTQAFSKLPTKEIADLAGPALKEKGNAGTLEMARFWLYEGLPAQALAILNKTSLAGAEAQELNDIVIALLEREADGEEELFQAPPGRERDGPKAPNDAHTAALIELTRKVEEEIIQDSIEQCNARVESLIISFKGIQKDGGKVENWEKTPYQKWHRINEEYKRERRNHDDYYYRKKKEYTVAREVFDRNMFVARETRDGTYHRTHNNSLRLIRKIRVGERPDLTEHEISTILKER